MTDEFLRPRRKALEDGFFHVQDQKLLAEFRQRLAAMERKKQLAAATGIHEEAVLDRLLALNIRPEALAAVTLVPLVEVAWADGKMPAATRAAVLQAAEESGICPQDEAYPLLQAWLEQPPGPGLMDVWKHYVGALCRNMDGQTRERFRHDLMDRALRVAESAGGILGIGRVCAEERAMLAELEQAFQ